MDFSSQQLPIVIAALGLVISTATAEFAIAKFVNEVRDGFHKREGGWVKFSSTYDLCWGYILGIGFNMVFFMIARYVAQHTVNTPLTGFGRFLWWLYAINLALWIGGVIIDLLRVFRWPGREV